MLSEQEISGIQTRLVETREDIADAAKKAGRDPKDVTLIAVSKFHPVEALGAAYAAGQRHFGENYIQEALDKQDQLSDLPITWHFIGKLQSNKAKFIPGRFSMVHTIDSGKLAHTLHKRIIAAEAPVQDVLIEVNLGRETQKAGIEEADLSQLAEELMTLDSLRVRGLMLLPPFTLTAEQRRPLFSRLRELRDMLETRLGQKLPVLSMGMTDDFHEAIAEGASIVRIGTRIFGPRPTKL